MPPDEREIPEPTERDTSRSSETEVGGVTGEDQPGGDDDDFGPPFESKTFGGAFVWAKGQRFVATVLRIQEGGNVVVSTDKREDMHIMLTGGRGVLEIEQAGEIDRVELEPAGPVFIDPGKRYRLLAMTEVELFTVYSPCE